MTKFLFFPLFLILPLLSQAAVLVRAPGASPKLYFHFLRENPQYQSVVQNAQMQARNGRQGEAELFSFAEKEKPSAREIEVFVGRLRSTEIMSKDSWLFLADYLLAKKETFKPADFKILQPLLCEAVFYADHAEKDTVSSCTWKAIPLDDLKAQWPETEGVFIETKFFDLKDQVMLPSASKNQWRLVSNAQSDFKFWGSFQELQKQQMPGVYFVEGSCGEFSVSASPWELIQSSAFFSAECVTPLNDPDKTGPSWMAKNKSWLLPTAGAFALGLIAYGMKDKNIVLKK